MIADFIVPSSRTYIIEALGAPGGLASTWTMMATGFWALGVFGVAKARNRASSAPDNVIGSEPNIGLLRSYPP